jgi:hypothetical protein
MYKIWSKQKSPPWAEIRYLQSQSITLEEFLNYKGKSRYWTCRNSSSYPLSRWPGQWYQLCRGCSECVPHLSVDVFWKMLNLNSVLRKYQTSQNWRKFSKWLNSIFQNYLLMKDNLVGTLLLLLHKCSWPDPGSQYTKLIYRCGIVVWRLSC